MCHFVFKMFTVGADALPKWECRRLLINWVKRRNSSVLLFNVAGPWNPYINVMESLP
jgi:hypothetical protein